MFLRQHKIHLRILIFFLATVALSLLLYFSLKYWLNLADVYAVPLLLLAAGAVFNSLLWQNMLVPLSRYASQTQEVLQDQKEIADLPEVELAELRPSYQLLQHMDKDLQEASRQVLLLTQDDQQTEIPISYKPLASALKQVRDEMEAIAQREKQRNWTTQGLATFVETLRSNQQDIHSLGEAIITELVKYLGANQGGLFILNEEEEEEGKLELIACYAYERKKHLQKKVAIGQGLIGQAFLEKEPIYLKQVPADYVHITSGLGEATPRTVLIVPLVINEEAFGVVELASFRDFSEYHIDFLKKLGESIASTISNARAAAHNQRLLEESQVQAEQMRNQEEEMRQNMEELQATQEEMMRAQQEMQKKEEENERMLQELTQVREQLKTELEAKLAELSEQQGRSEVLLNTTCDAILYLDEELNITYINAGTEKMFSYSAEQLIGKPLSILFKVDCSGKAFLQDYLERARQMGNHHEYVGKSNMYGFTFPVSVALTGGKVGDKKVYTVIIRDIRKQKEQEDRMQKTVNSAKKVHDQLMRREQDFKNMEKELAGIKKLLEEKDQTIAELQAGKA